MIYDVNAIDIAERRDVPGLRENAGYVYRVETQLQDTFAGHFDVTQVMDSRLSRLQCALEAGEKVGLDWRRGGLGATFLVNGMFSCSCWILKYPLPARIPLRPPVGGWITLSEADRIISAGLASGQRVSQWHAASICMDSDVQRLTVVEEVIALYKAGRLGLPLAQLRQVMPWEDEDGA